MAVGYEMFSLEPPVGKVYIKAWKKQMDIFESYFDYWNTNCCNLFEENYL